jgi:hypothetical protein
LRTRTIVLAAALLAVSGCTTPTFVGYSVVYGAVAMKKPLHPNFGEAEPWIDTTGMLVWGCGFAEITYKENSVVDALKYPEYETPEDEKVDYHTYKVPMGEWCSVRDHLLEGYFLVAYRQWHGKRYLLGSTPIFTDADWDDYVAYSDFITQNELAPLKRPIVQGLQNRGCFDEPERSESMIRVDDQYCFAEGVYLKDLPQN